MKERFGVLKSGTMFNRMSFNPRLWETKRKDVDGAGSTIAESIDESQIISRKSSEYDFNQYISLKLIYYNKNIIKIKCCIQCIF